VIKTGATSRTFAAIAIIKRQTFKLQQKGALMGLFDGLQDIISGVTDSVQNLKDEASTITEGLTGSVTSATEEGKTIIEDITNKLGGK
jgi:hypothetical protein